MNVLHECYSFWQVDSGVFVFLFCFHFCFLVLQNSCSSSEFHVLATIPISLGIFLFAWFETIWSLKSTLVNYEECLYRYIMWQVNVVSTNIAHGMLPEKVNLLLLSILYLACCFHVNYIFYMVQWRLIFYWNTFDI